jgi:putative PIN family toxin of toxin-antitoxin system
MARVVLDTNVWVSFFISPGGTCDALVNRLFSAGTTVVTSGVLMRELHRVLREKVGLSVEQADEATRDLRAVCELVEPTERIRVVKGKDDDNRVLECALAGKADAIISGDTRHLLPLGAFRGIPIVSPREALDRWL